MGHVQTNGCKEIIIKAIEKERERGEPPRMEDKRLENKYVARINKIDSGEVQRYEEEAELVKTFFDLGVRQVECGDGWLALIISLTLCAWALMILSVESVS